MLRMLWRLIRAPLAGTLLLAHHFFCFLCHGGVVASDGPLQSMSRLVEAATPAHVQCFGQVNCRVSCPY